MNKEIKEQTEVSIRFNLFNLTTFFILFDDALECCSVLCSVGPWFLFEYWKHFRVANISKKNKPEISRKKIS